MNGVMQLTNESTHSEALDWPNLVQRSKSVFPVDPSLLWIQIKASNMIGNYANSVELS